MIKVEDLSKLYKDGEENLFALKDVNLNINKGEIIAIVGESGSGKTTLLNMLGGLDKPTSGKVVLNGADYSLLNDKEIAVVRRKKIGIVFQFFNLLQSLNVEENIEMPILLDGEEMDEEFKEELFNILKLKDKRYKLPSELSGGQMQKVAIARALSNKPELILADEPTGNLDKKTSKEIIELLKYSCRKYHQTLIIITHDLDITREVDRVIKLEDGEIILDEVVS